MSLLRIFYDLRDACFMKYWVLVVLPSSISSIWFLTIMPRTQDERCGSRRQRCDVVVLLEKLRV